MYIENVKMKVKKEVKKYGKLLYLSLFGSKLYGTDNEKSDTDMKGVYLPSKDTMILGKHFVNRNIDSIFINDFEGYDIEIYSLQYFLKLCYKGDVGALDLLFSYTSPENPLFCSEYYEQMIINNSTNIFNRFNIKSFIGYSQSQAIKYGIKSEKLECIKNLLWFILTEFNNYNNISPNVKIYDIKQKLKEYIENHNYSKYCYFIIDDNGRNHRDSEDSIEYLSVCGKKHQTTISVLELINRLSSQEKSYCKRTESNIDTNNIDYKGLSHSLRVITECQSLLNEGKIEFPLYNREKIKRIKEGKLDLQDINKIINDEMSKTYELIELLDNDKNKNKFKVDIEFIKNIIINLYFIREYI